MSTGIQEENTPGAEFQQEALPEGHRDFRKGWGAPGHSLGNAVPGLHRGILSHPAGAGAERSEKSRI